MKKSLLVLAMLILSTGVACARTKNKNKTPVQPQTQVQTQTQIQSQQVQPQLLPIDTVLSTSPVSDPAIYDNKDAEDVKVDVPSDVMNAANTPAGTYEATYTPNAPRYSGNMIPQNAAAKGEPIPQKPQKLINIRTKQRSQGNDYWNPGGKGNRTYYD